MRRRSLVWAVLIAIAVLAHARADELLPAPVSPVPPLLDAAAVDGALAALDGIVTDGMKRTRVPGVAVGVVHRDRVVYEKGFGVREVGAPEPVDADTVFQLASVSKPITSTIVAGLVGRKIVDWNGPARDYDPDFALADPYVSEHATIGDLLAHRSGLHTSAGDLLEDLGFAQAYILARLRQHPLDRFRTSYHYSNFGYTAGAVAAAKAAGVRFEDLAEQILFRPAGMDTASFRHSDYLARPNRAHLHKHLADGSWAPLYDRQPDAEAPAGGASGSVRDLLRFLRLQLGGGALGGRPIVDGEALAIAQAPQIAARPPASPADRAGFYGYGWNVSYDDEGRTRIGHSGAFDLGAATTITVVPGEDLGIVVLTNGEPVGLAEAVGLAFLDRAQHGHLTVDWVGFMQGIWQGMAAEEPQGVGEAPANARPGHAVKDYVGTYANDYYGPLTVADTAEGLEMTLGPVVAPTRFALRHFDGDSWTFQTIGENAAGRSKAEFTVGADGRATKVVLGFYDSEGLGTFVRE